MTARDVIFIAVTMLMLGTTFFAIHYSYGTIADIMINHSEFNASVEASDSLRSSKEVTNRFDYIIFVTFMALSFALIITGWFIGGNAIFTFIYFIAIVIAIIVAAILNNVWVKFVSTPAFGAAQTIVHFPLTDALLSNLPLYIGIVGFVGLIVMFTKTTMAGGGGER